MREKTIQHYRVTLEQAKRDYQDGLLTATGLVFYAIAILKPPGQKLRIPKADEFADRLGIDRRTFYRVLSKLKLINLLEWEPTDGLNLWIPLDKGVGKLPQLTGERQIDHSERQIDHSVRQIDHSERQIDHSERQIDHSERQIDHSERQIDHNRGLKLASDIASTNPTDISTNTLQIFYKSLSNSERENFLKFVDRKIEQLPNKPVLPQKWIAKNLAELESEFRATEGNRRSVNLPNLEQMTKLQQMKDAGEIRDFGLQPYKKGQTIVVDDGSEVLPWWEFFKSR